MNLADRIETFLTLGKRLIQESEPQKGFAFSEVIESAEHYNPWFTPENTRYAARSIANDWLSERNLITWIGKYPETYFSTCNVKTVGVVMAGNIPFVGFHDLLCVLITGHRFLGKFSSKDGGLMNALCKMICEINPVFSDYISITEDNLQDFDAVLATGSSSSSKYFDYYFKNYPSIIRKHRNSIAVLSGNESVDELTGLGSDIFLYYGLGCRNVTKLFVPLGYDFEPLLNAFHPWEKLIINNKYVNNYEYYRALFLMNRIIHLDSGYLLIRDEESIGSPVGVLHFEYYSEPEDVKRKITSHANEIQCVVASSGLIPNSIPFGKSQHPSIDEYADGIDTIKFLNSLF